MVKGMKRFVDRQTAELERLRAEEEKLRGVVEAYAKVWSRAKLFNVLKGAGCLDYCANGSSTASTR